MNPRLDDAIAALLADRWADVVDLVLCRRDGIVEAHARGGSVGFTAAGEAWVRGRNPLARTDPAAFSPLDAERAALRPSNPDNHYPFAYDNVAHVFDHPFAPDLAVVHTPAHNWEERGGHRGEHGSCDVVQSRAPLIAAGAGIRRLGSIPAAARMVDVAPTLAALAGGTPDAGGAYLAGQHGRVLDEILDPSVRPARVVAFLCDGTNANVLYAMARAGDCPATARLMQEGAVFEHGLVASFPSVTLANHTTALTGAHPGAHRVLHNAYYDRGTGRVINTNSPETWHVARDELSPEVETVFEALARTGGGFTAAVNEPCDRGASYTTFDALRDGGEAAARIRDAMPDPATLPGATAAFVRERAEYAWSSAADHLAVEQAGRLWAGDDGNPRPALVWVNLILNDAGNHAGGPYSEIGRSALRDTDRRMGRILDAMDWGSGETAFLVLADHGMEESDPDCRGDYGDGLTAAGIGFRDEGFGFVYLDGSQ